MRKFLVLQDLEGRLFTRLLKLVAMFFIALSYLLSIGIQIAQQSTLRDRVANSYLAYMTRDPATALIK